MALYFGPDAETLLDPAFTDGYCFALAREERSRPRQVGLAFEPATRDPRRLDISGTLWVDTASRALRDIEFKYLGLPSRADAYDPGGHIEFREVRPGTVLIDRWVLRFVGAVPEAKPINLPGIKSIVSNRLFGAESGGELARAWWSDGTRWEGSLGRVQVRLIRDDGKPAVSVRLRIPETPYDAVSDVSGVVTYRDVSPGQYPALAMIEDPTLAVIELKIPTRTYLRSVRDSLVTMLDTALTAHGYVERRCGKRPLNRRMQDTAFVVGVAIDENAKPLEGAILAFAVKLKDGNWSVKRETYKTAADGYFFNCSGYEDTDILRIAGRKSGYPDAVTEGNIGTWLLITVLPFSKP